MSSGAIIVPGAVAPPAGEQQPQGGQAASWLHAIKEGIDAITDGNLGEGAVVDFDFVVEGGQTAIRVSCYGTGRAREDLPLEKSGDVVRNLQRDMNALGLGTPGINVPQGEARKRESHIKNRRGVAMKCRCWIFNIADAEAMEALNWE